MGIMTTYTYTNKNITSFSSPDKIGFHEYLASRSQGLLNTRDGRRILLRQSQEFSNANKNSTPYTYASKN